MKGWGRGGGGIPLALPLLTNAVKTILCIAVACVMCYELYHYSAKYDILNIQCFGSNLLQSTYQQLQCAMLNPAMNHD